MTLRSPAQVVCTECGQSFSARGLSGHRRLRHGLQPLPALPRDSNPRLDANPAILNALAGLQDAVERIELRLASMPYPPGHAETRAQETARLKNELDELLQHIVRFKLTGLAHTTIQRPATAAEERATLELARLRREQARLVFRIAELQHGNPRDERFLT